MSFLPFLLFLAYPSAPASAPAPVTHGAACFPLQVAHTDADGWLLLAALVVCTAGRLASQKSR
jgi:hypothetical protein